jgi:DNA invertase Pin-like site-specific DNA recombinase
MRLPRHLDDLRGLRAARWVRESTERQGDRYGPDAQREQQDRAIALYGLSDTGQAWQVHHSGRTITTAPEWGQMMAAAGRDYDVLLVGYVSRFARDLRTAVNARHDLHLAGAALLFCDERVLSSDEDAWESWAREAVEAEAYSRRLGRRIREGYEAKFRRLADPGGSAPLGFHRVEGLLEVDEATIARAVTVFERYSSGTVSLADLAAETGLAADALRMIVANPIYNGWARRHRRSADEQRRPTAWRLNPPVSDELWDRVQDVRRRRYNGGGHPTARHDHLLNGILFCACGRRIRAEMHASGRRYRHPGRCPEWTTQTVSAARFDEPLMEQVRQTRPTRRWLRQLHALATVRAPQPSQLRRRQVERELGERAMAHAQRRVATDVYLAEHRRLTQQLEELDAKPAEGLVDPDAAVRYLGDIQRYWPLASMAARHRLVAQLYDRVVVRSDGFVEVELSALADAHAIAAAMPERVVLARPAGFGPGRTTRVDIPIVTRREWLRLVRSA